MQHSYETRTLLAMRSAFGVKFQLVLQLKLK